MPPPPASRLIRPDLDPASPPISSSHPASLAPAGPTTVKYYLLLGTTTKGLSGRILPLVVVMAPPRTVTRRNSHLSFHPYFPSSHGHSLRLDRPSQLLLLHCRCQSPSDICHLRPQSGSCGLSFCRTAPACLLLRASAGFCATWVSMGLAWNNGPDRHVCSSRIV